MMGEGILITPLGRSPGAVSGLALALNKKLGPQTITKVITIGTADAEVIKVGRLLTKLFAETEIEYDDQYITQKELDSEEASTAFMIHIGQMMDALSQQHHQIHIGVTSGRSGMGALAALATNVYGADHLWHFWVHADIEDMGRLDRLPKPVRLTDNKYLDPTMDDRMYEIVPLPFMDLRPYHPELKRYYREYITAVQAGQTPDTPNTISPIAQLLLGQQAQTLEAIFPADLPIKAAGQIMHMIQQYPHQPEAEQALMAQDLVNMLGTYQIIDRRTRQRLLTLLETGGTTDKVWPILARDSDRQGVWTKVTVHKEAFDRLLSIGSFLFDLAQVILQIKSGR